MITCDICGKAPEKKETVSVGVFVAYNTGLLYEKVKDFPAVSVHLCDLCRTEAFERIKNALTSPREVIYKGLVPLHPPPSDQPVYWVTGDELRSVSDAGIPPAKPYTLEPKRPWWRTTFIYYLVGVFAGAFVARFYQHMGWFQ